MKTTQTQIIGFNPDLLTLGDSLSINTIKLTFIEKKLDTIHAGNILIFEITNKE
jgi:hypothetical protein